MMEKIKAEKIHRASLELLEDPGIKLEHGDISELVLKNGGRKGYDADVVRIPPELVEECLKQCPGEVELCDRKGNATVISAESEPAFWSAPGMYLYREGEHRPFDSGDMADMARLLEQLENVHVVFGMAMDDIPPRVRDVVGLKVMANNCTKHIRVLCFSPEGAEALVEMQQVVGDYPWLSIGFTAHGPLRWTELALEIYCRTAGHGLPVTINGEPMAGVSGPVTVAGSAAVGNAEILAGIVINQLLEPGRPCIYNLGLAHTFDMRTAIAVTGGPENALFARVAAWMGRFYGLPSSSWVSTESMCPDEQAALEKMFGFQSHVESGVSAIWGVGQLESELTLSPAQAVIDNEMISYVKRFRRGVEVDDESLALEVTRRVGIAGSFLEDDHTLMNFRSELFSPELLWRDRRAVWDEGGKKDLAARAEERASELMVNSVENGMDEEQVAELEKIADRLAQDA
jgi:trimethylamine---corrinoid protein Co-methyltransferase